MQDIISKDGIKKYLKATDVFDIHIFDSVSSISDYLYCSEGNAKVRLWRTRNKLRHFLESKGVII